MNVCVESERIKHSLYFFKHFEFFHTKEFWIMLFWQIKQINLVVA